jgi:peptidoglycan/LPS O-acetylase OafA/YrhL
MMNKKSHLLAVDILRGIAIAMVVVFHAFIVPFGAFLPWTGWHRDLSMAPSKTFIIFYPISFGWAGVALFFVLSGFCIHLSFLRSPTFSVQKFIWNRFWRIMPAYLVALIAFSFLNDLAFNNYEGLKQFVTHLMFIHNFSDSTFFQINPSFWSIATEVQLYALFPLLLVVRQRIGIEGCLAFTLFIGLAWRVFVLTRWGLPDHVIAPGLSSPFSTWFDWTLGAFVAERFGQSRMAFSRHLLWLELAIPTFVISTFYKPLTVFSFSLAAVISAIILDWLIWANIRKTIVASGLGFIGALSYSIYLWHQPLLFRFVPSLSQHANTYTILVLVASSILFLSFLSFRIIERGGIFMGMNLWNQRKIWHNQSLQ